MSLIPVLVDLETSENQTPGERDGLSLKRLDRRPNASKAGPLTIEQRLERIEKILAQKLKIDYASDEGGAYSASAFVLSENDRLSNQPMTKHPRCEERFVRLEEQLARVLGRDTQRATRHDINNDLPTEYLDSHPDSSHGPEWTDQEPRDDDRYGISEEFRESARAGLVRNCRDGGGGRKAPRVDDISGLGDVKLRPEDECQVM